MAEFFPEVQYHYVQALKAHSTVETAVYTLLRGLSPDAFRALAKAVAYECEVRNHRRSDLTAYSLDVGDAFLNIEPIICRLWREALEQEKILND